MKVKKNKKSKYNKSTETTKNQTISAVRAKSSDIILLWQKLLAKSDLKLVVDNSIFHYEIYLRGEKLSYDCYRSVSKIKFCVKYLEYEGVVYDFFINPVDKISRCKDLVFDWYEVTWSAPVLTKEEMTFEEQLNKHLVALENHIRENILPVLTASVAKRTKSDFA